MNKFPLVFITTLLLIGAIGVAGYFFFGSMGNRGFPQALPVQSYLGNPTQLSGNRYHLEAEVRSLLDSKTDVGRIFLVQPEAGGSSLPVFLPATLGSNLEFQQRYRFHLEIDSDGLLTVLQLRKI